MTTDRSADPARPPVGPAPGPAATVPPGVVPGSAGVVLEPVITEVFGLRGKVAVVTGASSGLGVTIAASLAAAGATVVLAARRAGALDRLAGVLAARGAEVLVVPTDVSVEAACHDLAGATVAAHGRVDVLVNNAGIAVGAAALDETTEQWDRTIATNLSGAYFLAKACVPHMGPGSAIVNVSSFLGLRTERIPHAAYSATKAGLLGLTRELARQWALRGIRVNALAPGYFTSEMSDQFPDGYLDRLAAERIPLRRLGGPDDLVGTTLFLASPASGYLTGQVLVLDGGISIT